MNDNSALKGLKVLDLSRVLAGPWCTQLLGDLGADVVKIENPDGGDDTRSWGPPFVKDYHGHETNLATYYLSCNRNKRSVTVNIKTGEGQRLIRKMAEQSDVLVENFKVGGLKQYGLDYASLQKLNPRLIYCSITGFGQDGPYAGRAGYDLLIQGMAGLMSVTGRSDSEPGAGPLRIGVPLCDLFTGMYASTAILAALQARNIGGKGQHLDISLLDVGITVLANHASAFLNAGVVPKRQGNSHASLAPYQDFPTADGSMILAIGNDLQFARFCEVANKHDWLTESRYATSTLRVKHRNTLIPAMEALTRTRTTSEWVTLLEHNAVPCGPINSIEQVFADPHVKARSLRVTLPRNTEDGIGSIDGVACPIRFSLSPIVLERAPPALGQHTKEVLCEIGLDEAAIEAHRICGII